MLVIAKIIILLFGIFLIVAGFIMLSKPEKANATLQKAASTNFINYAEITIRMIPAAAMIIYAEASKYPRAFMIFGWFMLATSLLLYFIPRKVHYSYSQKWAAILKPLYFQLISPLSLFFGALIIYSIL